MSSSIKRSLVLFLCCCSLLNFLFYLLYVSSSVVPVRPTFDTNSSTDKIPDHSVSNISHYHLPRKLPESANSPKVNAENDHRTSLGPFSSRHVPIHAETSQGAISNDLKNVFQNFSLSFKDLGLGKKVPRNYDNVNFLKFVMTMATERPNAAIRVSEVTSEPTKTTSVHIPNYPNPHPYNWTINEEHTCENKPDLLFVVVVCSGLNNVLERKAIRDTWGSSLQLTQNKAALVFLVGGTNQQDIQGRIQNESLQYRDIIQENFLDTYRNLSLKSVALLNWVRDNCLNARFVLKTDDDMYINLKVLHKTLSAIRPVRTLVGTLIVGAKPVQNKSSKWYTPKADFPERVYPKYCSGTAYVISTDIVGDLFNVTLYTKLFWLEDIYITGLCARKLKPRYISKATFTFNQRPATACAFESVVSGHKVPPKDMRKIWRELQALKKKCTDPKRILKNRKLKTPRQRSRAKTSGKNKPA